jgi:hypothetical protein
MTLSAERMLALEDHYEVWGLDEVRKELNRPDRDTFLHPEVTEFARAWVEAKEKSLVRAKWRRQIGLVMGLLFLGAAIAIVLRFWDRT